MPANDYSQYLKDLQAAAEHQHAMEEKNVGESIIQCKTFEPTPAGFVLCPTLRGVLPEFSSCPSSIIHSLPPIVWN